MSAPAVLRWPLDAALFRGAVPILCPQCGCDEPLTLAMDREDRSDGPSYMTCPQGHTWAEPLFPRRMAAELFDEMIRLYPWLLSRLDEIRELQERGDA